MFLEPNLEQQQVIDTTESPLLVIAGPGAGKTKTLVDRVIHLIVDKKVPSEQIMVATFTEKAGKELITRISNKAVELNVIVNISDMYVGTLHSIFLHILEEYRQHTNLKRNYRVLDDFEQNYLIYRNLQLFNEIENHTVLYDDFGWDTAKTISLLVNKVSEDNLDIQKLSECTGSIYLPILAELTKKYRTLLESENAIDFSLIQTKMWELLKDDYVLNDIRQKIQYFMIDEYQDTNRIQEMILLKLAKPNNKICVVGDDDQALYRFRGATVENILRFQENFPKDECRKIELTKNYRSHPDVIDFYNRWMASPYNDKDGCGSWHGDDGEEFRHKKIIENSGEQNRENTKYPGVVKVAGSNQEEWNQEFYEFVCKLKECGKLQNYNQITVLSKSVKNKKISELAAFLENNGIPVFSPRSDMFFERNEIKLVIGAFGFLFPKLVDNYLVGKSTIRKKVWDYYENCITYFGEELRNNPEKNKSLRVWAVTKSRELGSLKENTNYTFADLFYELLQFPLFRDLVNVDLSSGIQDLRPIYNLALFSKLITKFEFLNNVIVLRPEYLKRDVKNLFNSYLNFLYDGGLGEFEDFDMTTPSGCISFMTIHQSKGLEFPITCVDSLDNVPRKDFDEIDLDIENFYYKKKSWEPLERTKYFDFWRLYYTAFSRAQNLLVLTGIDNRATKQKGEKSSPSKYFSFIYPYAFNWKKLFEKEYPDFVLDVVKKANIKHEYSFTSHILLYENCPVQYKFFRELEFVPVRTTAVMFGTLVHQTIEDVHKAVIEGHTEKITDENIYHWMRENYGQLSKQTGLYLRESALNVILRHVNQYVDYAKKDWSKVKEAEVPVTLQKENFILEGKIDLIQGHDDTVEILDFKTEKKPDINTEEGREKLHRYRRQLEIYAHIIENRYGQKVSKMHLYYTGAESESPFISYDFNSASIKNTIDEVSNVVEQIENKNFTINPKKRCKQLCGDCDLKNYCNSI